MRKTLLLGVIMFGLVTCAGFALGWFIQALAAKKFVAQTIEKLNAAYPGFSYESLSTSGFPGTLTVSIVKPRFSGSIDARTLLGSADPSLPAPWQQEVALDGSLSFGINIFSNRYTMTVRGDWQITSTIGEQQFSAYSKPAGDSVCALDIAHSQGVLDTMWDFGAFTRSLEDFSAAFRMFDCASQGGSYWNGATKEKLAENGPMRFYITNLPAEGGTQARLYMQVKDSELAPAFDTFSAAVNQALSPQEKSPLPMFGGYEYGKQNVEIDIGYSGPMKPVGGEPFDLQISKFIIGNAAYTLNTAGRATRQVDGAIQNSALNYRLEYNAAPPSDRLLESLLRQGVDALYNGHAAAFPQWKAALAKYKSDQLYGMLLPALPDAHSLGKVVVAVDGGYKGDVNFYAGAATLHHFEFSSPLYGIAAKGTLTTGMGPLLSSMNSLLTCTNCLRLVDDAGGYLIRLKTALAALDADAAAHIDVTPEKIFGFKNFLTELNSASGLQGDKNTLLFSVVSNGPITTINGKPLDEVITTLNRHTQPVKRKK